MQSEMEGQLSDLGNKVKKTMLQQKCKSYKTQDLGGNAQNADINFSGFSQVMIFSWEIEENNIINNVSEANWA